MAKNEDIELINQQWSETINQLRDDYNRWEKHTFKDYVLRCAEILERRIKLGILEIPRESISSYLYQELNKEGINVTDRWIREVLPNQYKRNYSESELTSEIKKGEWKKLAENKDVIVEKDQFGNYKINGEEVIIKQKPKEKPIDSKPVKKPNKFQVHLLRIASNLTELAHVYDSYIDKYDRDENAREVIETIFKDIDKLEKEQKDIYAEITSIAKQSDFRQRIGKYEKLKAVLLDKCLLNTSRVAKLLVPPFKCRKCGEFNSGITSKHMSANILRKEFPELHENTRNWFKCIEFNIGNKKVVVDIGQYFDSQYIRGELGLDIRKPFIIDYKAE